MTGYPVTIVEPVMPARGQVLLCRTCDTTCTAPAASEHPYKRWAGQRIRANCVHCRCRFFTWAGAGC